MLNTAFETVVIGLFLGSGLTGALGAALLATPAAALIGSSVRLFDPAAYVAALLDRRDVDVRSAGFRATGHEDRSGGRAQAGVTWSTGTLSSAAAAGELRAPRAS